MTEQNTPNRIFKIGTTTIVEDDSMREKTLDEIKILLKRTYSEVAHATVRDQCACKIVSRQMFGMMR